MTIIKESISSSFIKQARDGCVENRPPPLPNPDEFGALAQRLISDSGPSIIRVAEARNDHKRPKTVYYVARHDFVSRILHDTEHFSLSHYDDLLFAAAKDVRFFLGENSPAQELRIKMLHAGRLRQYENEWAGEKLEPGAVEDPVRAEIERRTIEKASLVARANSERVITSILSQHGRQGKFNIVRHYGFFVPYLTAVRFFGVRGPQHPSLLVRAFILMRNMTNRGHPLRLSHETAPYFSMLTWFHIIFGHVFVNFENRDRLLLAAARRASSQWSAHLKNAVENRRVEYGDSMLAYLLDVRPMFPDVSDTEFNDNVRLILFELIGAMISLVGVSFAKIADLLFKKRENGEQDLNFDRFLMDLDNEHVSVSAIDEALRLNPTTTSLRRRVKKRIRLGDAVLEVGDEIQLLLEGACLDHRAFSSPQIFNPQPDRPYLNFGPVGGPHQCYGQRWARAILKEMLVAMAELRNLKRDNEFGALRSFQKLPDQMVFQYNFPEDEFAARTALLSDI